jgi:hypothetical protein
VSERAKKDSRGLLQALLGFGDRSARRRETIIDLLLMAGLADGDLSLIDEDRIAHAIHTQPELAGFDWDELVDRIEIIQGDAPLFSETRARLVRDLEDPEPRRFALTLTARFLGTPLGEEETALLSALAGEFGIDESEREALLQPWTDADPFQMGYLRSDFNNPASLRRGTLFDAMERTQSDPELALLTFKLTALRVAMTRISETAELVSLGEVLECNADIREGRSRDDGTGEETSLRVDALIKHEHRRFVARFVAKGEALYPAERRLFRTMLEQAHPSVTLLIGHADPTLCPPDEASLRRLPPGRVITERLEL